MTIISGTWWAITDVTAHFKPHAGVIIKMAKYISEGVTTLVILGD